jgi:uncharacterized protein YdgA (DUF945 family)
MKKILLIIVAIVVAVVIFLPKFISMQLASGLQNTVDTINEKTAYEVSIEEINSGWMSTQAVLNVALKMPDFGATPATMTGEMLDISAMVNVNVSHGPILTSGDSLIGLLHTVISAQNPTLPPALVLATQDQDASIFSIDANTALFGKTDFVSTVLGMTYTDPESGMVAAFSGLNSQGSLSSNGYTFIGNTESVTIGSDEMQVATINNITLEGSSDVGMMQMMTQGLYNSESTISIADMAFTNMFDGSQTTVTDTEMLVITTLDDATDMGDVIIKTTMSQFNATDMNIADLIMTIDVKNLQAKFMRAYVEFSAKSSEYMTDPVAMQDAMQAFLDEHLLEQLQQNPEYNVSELSGKVNGSEFNGQVLTKLTNVTELPSTMEDPAFWVQHADVDTQMSMQKGAAEFFAAEFVKTQLAGNPQFLSMSEEEQQQILTQQVQGTLAALVQQGMLVAEGDDYQFSFTLKESAALLNGNPMPLPF